jgi:hypothetical protein
LKVSNCSTPTYKSEGGRREKGFVVLRLRAHIRTSLTGGLHVNCGLGAFCSDRVHQSRTLSNGLNALE